MVAEKFLEILDRDLILFSFISHWLNYGKFLQDFPLYYPMWNMKIKCKISITQGFISQKRHKHCTKAVLEQSFIVIFPLYFSL